MIENYHWAVGLFVLGFGMITSYHLIRMYRRWSLQGRRNSAKEIDLTVAKIKFDNDKRSDSELLDHASRRDESDPSSPTYKKK